MLMKVWYWIIPQNLQVIHLLAFKEVHTILTLVKVLLLLPLLLEGIWLPSEPPPLVHYLAESMTSSSITNPFTLTLISGNISVCRGCRQRYVKPATPPIDLCIRHKEWQDFIDPTGHPQQRLILVMCIIIVTFLASLLVVPHFLL